MKGKIHIGLSGWSYSSWKGNFYPRELKSADYLNYYSGHFKQTEVNSSFYHLPRVSTIEGWMGKVPKDFKFCFKMSRYITHIKRLNEVEESLAKFFNAIEPAGKMAGPVLIQLPPSLKLDMDKAETFFKTLSSDYKGYQFAVEARHASWFSVEGTNLLSQYKTALVIAESGDRFPYLEAITAKHIYVRFHGAEKLYASSYPDEVLKRFAEKIVAWKNEGHTVWVFFNNTMFDAALLNAATLQKMIKELI